MSRCSGAKGLRTVRVQFPTPGLCSGINAAGAHRRPDWTDYLMATDCEFKDDDNPGNICSRPASGRDRSTLREMAIAAIIEHRRLTEADQQVYDEWSRASADPTIPHSVVARLREKYFARQKKSQIQQNELADLISELGYVPDVPGDGEA